jgi:hypothetical protein
MSSGYAYEVANAADEVKWACGDLVELDGLIGVVVFVFGDPDVPEEHIAVWFGDPKCTRISKGGTGGLHPELWTVPADLLKRAATPTIKH